MPSGRHARPREPALPALAGWACALVAAVLAALTSDPRFLRLAVVLALAAVVPHALAAARAPRRSDLRALRRELAVLRSELSVRPVPLVEVVLVPTPEPAVAGPASVNGNAHVDRSDRRRLVLDLVALEEASDSVRT